MVLRHDFKVRERFGTGFVTSQSGTQHSVPFRKALIHGQIVWKYSTFLQNYTTKKIILNNLLSF